MLTLPTVFALWQQMANCDARMDLRTVAGGPVASSWFYRYDENGDLRWAQLQDGTGFVNMTLTFAYDQDGNLVEADTNPHDDGRAARRVRYTYIDGVPVLAETDTRTDGSVDALTRTEWLGGERITAATDDQGDGTWERWAVVWTDDSPFRLERRVEFIEPDGDAAEDFAYDDLGRLVETSTDQDGDGLADRTVWRGYDAYGRILWKDADNDGDGLADTAATWSWWCGAEPRQP